MGKQPRHFQSAMKGLRKPFAVIFSLAMAMSSLPVGALEALAEELEADNEGSAQAIVIDTAANDAETNLRAQAEGTEKPSVEPQEKSAAAAAAGTTLTYEDDTLVVTVNDFLTLGEDELLVGAKFQLKKKNATDGSLTDVGDPQSTDANGKLTFSNLQPNTTYVITETEAPEGWSRREDIEFEVLANGTVRLVTGYVENDPMAAGLGDPDANLKYPLTVPNTRTYALPAAGGPGVYPFLLAGAFAAAYAASGASDERRRTSGRKASRRRAAGPLGGD